MHPQSNQNKCCVSVFHITTEEPSFCEISKANQTANANTGSLVPATVLYEREKALTHTIQTRMTNIYSQGIHPLNIFDHFPSHSANQH